MTEINAGTNTEVLILRNPLYYKVAAPAEFEIMIEDGTWLPLVFGVVRAVVEQHFFELCELDWDYVHVEEKIPEGFVRYKSCFSKNLNAEQSALVQTVADEIEEAIAAAARQMIEDRESGADIEG
ncbi:MAG: hypothetical protein ACOX0A_06110 [Thermoguttaceae bacterium]|jgi:hypothetical protein